MRYGIFVFEWQWIVHTVPLIQLGTDWLNQYKLLSLLHSSSWHQWLTLTVSHLLRVRLTSRTDSFKFYCFNLSERLTRVCSHYTITSGSQGLLLFHLCILILSLLLLFILVAMTWKSLRGRKWGTRIAVSSQFLYSINISEFVSTDVKNSDSSSFNWKNEWRRVSMSRK